MSILASVEEAKRQVAGASGEQPAPSGRGGHPDRGAVPAAGAGQRIPPVCRGSRCIIFEDLTAHVIENCLRGELDVGVRACRLSDPRLARRAAVRGGVLLAMPAGHPLTKRRKVTVDDLNGQAFILLSEMHCLGEQVLSLCRAHDFQTNDHLPPAGMPRSGTVQALDLAREFLLPDMACRRRRGRRGAARRAIAAVWRRHRYHSPAAALLLHRWASACAQALVNGGKRE